jgi:hypothetical protein
MSDLYDYNFEVWQLVWKLTQSKEKYRIALQEERVAHEKSKEELQYVKNLICRMDRKKSTLSRSRQFFNKLAFWKN